MEYLAVLGRQPEVGLVELESTIGADAIERFGRHALLNQPIELQRFGGVIKLGRIIQRLPATPLDRLQLDPSLLPRPDNGKLTFGISWYGRRAVSTGSIERFGLQLKKQLRLGGSVRYIAPKRPASQLSAAQLKYNQLPEAGFELMLTDDGTAMVVAMLEQFQDIDAYAQRDYGRPARDARIGMLPPKLAQALVNTTHAKTVYDPFCGSGVILQEALLIGRAAGGSDQATTMVEATRTNLQWLAQQHSSALPEWSVTQADSRSVTLPVGSAVVSEGYLGPNLTGEPSGQELERLRTELGQLYRDTLTHFAAQQRRGDEVSLCLPAWRSRSQWYLPYGVVDALGDLGYTNKAFRTVTRPILYAQPDQIVGRQLLLLTRQ